MEYFIKKAEYIKQGYISTDSSRIVRVRIINGERGELTIKGKKEFYSCFDINHSIQLDEAEDLMKLTTGIQIRKIRYTVGDWLLDAMECSSSGSYQLDKNDKVVISPVRNIQAEWRYFIIDRKIVSGSMYRAYGRLRKQEELNEDVLKEAQSFADNWLPHECCVMDLALVDDEVKVIEFNCINSSGFYDNDVNEIFNKLYQYNTK